MLCFHLNRFFILNKVSKVASSNPVLSYGNGLSILNVIKRFRNSIFSMRVLINLTYKSNKISPVNFMYIYGIMKTLFLFNFFNNILATIWCSRSNFHKYCISSIIYLLQQWSDWKSFQFFLIIKNSVLVHKLHINYTTHM